MKRMLTITMAFMLIFMLSACGGNETPVTSSETAQPSQNPVSEQQEEGRGDLFEEQIPENADVIGQGVYYYELVELSGDYGDGLSPREGAELTDKLLADIGMYSENGGIPADQCVYISLDELAVLDSAMGRECYIYSVGIGTPEGGLMGDDYQVVYRVSVDYSGEKTAAIYEDFSSDYSGDGRGDLFDDEQDASGRGDAFSDKTGFTLVADFSNGMSNADSKTKEIPLPPRNEMPASDALVAGYLADELSEWTGLKFSVNDVIFENDFVTVDWAGDSTLIAGLGNQTQKEGFHFYDAVSLNWFMMDSLAQTLKQNFDISEVYYSYGYGAVTFPNPEDMAAQGLASLPPDQPYEGSAFFVAHAGNR